MAMITKCPAAAATSVDNPGEVTARTRFEAVINRMRMRQLYCSAATGVPTLTDYGASIEGTVDRP